MKKSYAVKCVGVALGIISALSIMAFPGTASADTYGCFCGASVAAVLGATGSEADFGNYHLMAISQSAGGDPPDCGGSGVVDDVLVQFRAWNYVNGSWQQLDFHEAWGYDTSAMVVAGGWTCVDQGGCYFSNHYATAYHYAWKDNDWA